MSAELTYDPFRPRAVDASAAGGLLALAAHALLLVALSLGVSWHIKVPEGGEAELWSEIPKAAAPETMPAPPEPAPAPEPKPAEPTPEPEPPPRPAQIAVKKEPPPKPVKLKPEPKPKPVKVEPPPKPLKPTPAKPTQAELAAQAKAEAARQKILRDMVAAAGGDSLSANPNVGHGPSVSKGYGAKVAAAIKRNIVFPDTINGNPTAVVSVRCSPNGRIIARRLTQPSGVPAWDEAVLRAIDRTETLPLDENGGVPSTMEIEFRPRDN